MIILTAGKELFCTSCKTRTIYEEEKDLKEFKKNT